MNQKIIYSFLAVILVWVIGFTTYTHLGSSDFSVENITTEVSGKLLKIDTQLIQEENSEKYDYYQLYIYPKEYTLECNQNEWLCSSVMANQSRLKNYTLKFIGKDLKVSSADDIVFDFDFSSYKIQKHLLTSMFEDLFVRDSSDKKDAKPVAQEICEETIRSSMIWGDWDTDFLQQRIESECQGTDLIGETKFAFGWLEGESEKSKNLKLKVSITSMRLVYKFFIKQDGKYIEKEVQEKIVENPLILDASVDLSGF